MRVLEALPTNIFGQNLFLRLTFQNDENQYLDTESTQILLQVLNFPTNSSMAYLFWIDLRFFLYHAPIIV